jgi:hypothetical protein
MGACAANIGKKQNTRFVHFYLCESRVESRDKVNPGTGFIITRSAKDGSVLMEMIRIGRDTQHPDTTYVDANDDLPGTTEMLFITEQKIQVVAEFMQLMPITSIPLPLLPSLVQLHGRRRGGVSSLC